MQTAVILQPTYLPWLGYFDMMDQGDIFVLLDSVQYDKHSWQQRNKIKIPHGELLLTVPVSSKGLFNQKIRQVKIDANSDFQRKHLKTIEVNYKRARFFEKYFYSLKEILTKKHIYLADLTIELISWFKQILGIEAELISSSSFDIKGKKVESLIKICKKVGCQRYLSPKGSQEYIEKNNLFAENGIELIHHNYQDPIYTQLHSNFISRLSTLDLLFNEGENSLTIIRSGRKE